MDLLDDEIDRYHDINLQIKNIERNLSNVEKQQERLTGKDLVDNLNKQLEYENEIYSSWRFAYRKTCKRVFYDK